jgi:hypothetical protein
MDRKPARTGTATSGQGPPKPTSRDGQATEQQTGPPEFAPETGTPMYSMGGHGSEGATPRHAATGERPPPDDTQPEHGTTAPDRR